MSCQATSCQPILQAPNGTLWQLGVTNGGLLTTTQVFLSLKYLQPPVLGAGGVAWQISATNGGLMVTTKVNPVRPPMLYIPMAAANNSRWLLTVTINGLLVTTSTTLALPESIPYPIDVTMSVFGDTCSNFVQCPVCNNAHVTVSGDLSCWCCACSSFVLPEDTTITVVLDE